VLHRSLHPLLSVLFESLERADVRWALLRVPSVPEAPTGDVDLLVHRADLRRLREVLDARGFVGVPGWQQPPSMLFVAYDDPSAHLLLLDVTDEVSFGPEGQFATQAASTLLGDSRWVDGTRVLEPSDAFWALLLHCLLDKGVVPEHYRGRLTAGAKTADADSVLGRTLGVQAASLRDAAASSDWTAVERAAPGVAATWTARMSPVDRLRTRRRGAVRRLRAPLLLRRRFGLSVALLGPNGAGKSTLSDGIERAWPFAVTRVYMGLWKSGGSAGSEVPVLAQLLRPPTAWVRYLTGVRAQLRGHLVIYDRYVHDARRPPQPPWAGLKRIYLWLLAHSVPPPDLLVLLDVPGTVSHGRKAENSLEEADRERAEFLAIARAIPSMHVIDATQPADRVRADTLRIIWERCRVRWGAPAAEPAEPAASAALPGRR
jgi:thymidylate kinase